MSTCLFVALSSVVPLRNAGSAPAFFSDDLRGGGRLFTAASRLGAKTNVTLIPLSRAASVCLCTEVTQTHISPPTGGEDRRAWTDERGRVMTAGTLSCHVLRLLQGHSFSVVVSMRLLEGSALSIMHEFDSQQQ